MTDFRFCDYKIWNRAINLIINIDDLLDIDKNAYL